MKLDRYDIEVFPQAAVSADIRAAARCDLGKAFELQIESTGVVELNQSIAFQRSDVPLHVRNIGKLLNVHWVIHGSAIEAAKNFFLLGTNVFSVGVQAGLLLCSFFAHGRTFGKALVIRIVNPNRRSLADSFDQRCFGLHGALQ